MGASAAVRGLLRISLANSAFRPTESGEDAAPHYIWPTSTEKIRDVLRHAGYSVTQLSASTGRRYGTASPYFIPPTFLHKLRYGVTPHVCQVVALSESTGYRFVDWMKMCGFDLHQIPRLQLRLHTERTVLITPMEFDADSSGSQSSAFQAGVCASSINWRSDRRRYVWAKIGRRDAGVFRQLMPGVIVRVDRCYGQWIHELDRVAPRNLLWLVELPGGMTCCHLKWIDNHQIVLLPSRHPWGGLPLRLPTEARILGLVDTEHGSLKEAAWQPRAGPMKLELASRPRGGCEKVTVPDMLRDSRRRAGLTFREAHQLTAAIAQVLGRRDYAIGLGLLSDYEAMAKLPRHIAKIISLCIAYGIDVRDLMEAAGVMIDDSAKLPLPALDQPIPHPANFLDGVEQYQTIGIGAGYGQP